MEVNIYTVKSLQNISILYVVINCTSIFLSPKFFPCTTMLKCSFITLNFQLYLILWGCLVDSIIVIPCLIIKNCGISVCYSNKLFFFFVLTAVKMTKLYVLKVLNFFVFEFFVFESTSTSAASLVPNRENGTA